MLRTHRGQKSDGPSTVTLVIFTIAGRKLGARAEHVGGVRPWVGEMPVPSRTPFVGAVLRQGEDILPVFDLAARLSLQPLGISPWYLILKCVDGPVAVRVEGEMPQIQTVKTEMLHAQEGTIPDVDMVCRIGMEEVPVLSVATLEKAPEVIRLLSRGREQSLKIEEGEPWRWYWLRTTASVSGRSRNVS